MRAEAAIVGRRASHRRLAGHRDGEPIDGSGARRDEVVEQLFDNGLAMRIAANAAMPVLTVPAVQPPGGRGGNMDEVTPRLRAVRDDEVVEPAGHADLYSTLSTIFLQDSVRRSAAALAGARRRHRPGRRRNSRRPTARGAAASDSPTAAVDVPIAGAGREARLLEALVTLADPLVPGYDRTAAMGYLVDVCTELLAAEGACLLLDDGHGRLDVVASSGHQPESLALVQVHTRTGPIWECMTTGAVRSVTDIAATAQRWPQFALLAADQGVQAVHAVPLRVRGTMIGTLSLFRSRPGELTEADRRVVRALADVATAGVLQHRPAGASVVVKDQWQQTLSGRVVIDQAKGVLAEFGGVGMDQAFAELRAYARRHRIGVTELAEGVVDRRRHPGDILPAQSRRLTTTRAETSPRRSLSVEE